MIASLNMFARAACLSVLRVFGFQARSEHPTRGHAGAGVGDDRARAVLDAAGFLSVAPTKRAHAGR